MKFYFSEGIWKEGGRGFDDNVEFFIFFGFFYVFFLFIYFISYICILGFIEVFKKIIRYNM